MKRQSDKRRPDGARYLRLTLFERDFIFSSAHVPRLREYLELKYGKRIVSLEGTAPDGAYCLNFTNTRHEKKHERNTPVIPLGYSDSGPSLEFDAGARSATVFAGGEVEAEVVISALTTFVQLVLREKSLLFIHASAVVMDDRAILFAGQNGSGKSTLARTMLERGAGYLADDATILDTGQTPVTARMNPELFNASEFSSAARRALLERGFERAEFEQFLSPPAGDIAAPVSTLLFPSILKAPVSLVSLTKKDALLRLLSLSKTRVLPADYGFFFDACERLATRAVCAEITISEGKPFPIERVIEFSGSL